VPIVGTCRAPRRLVAAHNMENAVQEFATTAQKLAVWPYRPADDEACSIMWNAPACWLLP
jgi:hypothetical protein